MVRAFTAAFILALLCGGLLAPGALAGDEKKRDEPLTLASDEEAAELLAEFKLNYKAKGLTGEDRVMQRDYAMRQISKVQHPEIVKALGKVTKSGDGDLRMIAVIYLSDQRALPHLASKYILGAMKRDKKDVVMLMTGLQSLGSLKYLGAAHNIRALLKHKHFVVRKTAITAVGAVGDVRMLNDVLGILGVKLESEKEGAKDPDKKKSGGKEVVEPGYSWEGAEAVVDRGEADNTKENADAKRQAEAQIARNKAAATSGRGGGGGGGVGGNNSGVGGGGGSSGGRGGSSRSTEELIPAILRTLKALTGEEFDKPSSIRTWVKANKPFLADEKKRLDKLEKAQKANTGS